MLPVVSAPSVQMAPPVETSLFIGQISEPALGRLPPHTVPAPIASFRTSDNSKGGNLTRNSFLDAQLSVDNLAAISAGSSHPTGDILLESPFSTTFVAQLFGQLPTLDTVFSDVAGERSGIPSGFVDFERLAQFSETKYKPSEAFKPQAKSAQTQTLEGADIKVVQEKVARIERAMEESKKVQQVVDFQQATPDSATAPDAVKAPTANALDFKREIAPAATEGTGKLFEAEGKARLVKQQQQNIAPATAEFKTAPEAISPRYQGQEAYRSTDARNIFNLGSNKPEVVMVL